jgi:Zn-dependent protease
MRNGAFRLFRALGVTVYLHWSWLIIAAIQIKNNHGYQQPMWRVWEYLFLFGIVLMHEYGHALATRSVGGSADTIVLWPLGGVAFVNPPARPGAFLWSIAAGPLVNLVLVPVTIGISMWAGVDFSAGMEQRDDLRQFLFMLTFINLILLVFNMMPVYRSTAGRSFRASCGFSCRAARASPSRPASAWCARS